MFSGRAAGSDAELRQTPIASFWRDKLRTRPPRISGEMERASVEIARVAWAVGVINQEGFLGLDRAGDRRW